MKMLLELFYEDQIDRCSEVEKRIAMHYSLTELNRMKLTYNFYMQKNLFHNEISRKRIYNLLTEPHKIIRIDI